MGITYTLLNNIRERPGMYIGTASLSNLWMYLQGYVYAHLEVGVDSKDDIDFRDNFYPWLEKKWQVNLNTNWYKLIMLYSSSEEYGFHLFYQLLDEFRRGSIR